MNSNDGFAPWSAVELVDRALADQETYLGDVICFRRSRDGVPLTFTQMQGSLQAQDSDALSFVRDVSHVAVRAVQLRHAQRKT